MMEIDESNLLVKRTCFFLKLVLHTEEGWSIDLQPPLGGLYESSKEPLVHCFYLCAHQ
jgi:hypothetical protein